MTRFELIFNRIIIIVLTYNALLGGQIKVIGLTMSELKNESGIILGLGLITIIIIFTSMLNKTYWYLLLNKKKNQDLELDKEYHQWVYTSDDVLNKVLKDMCLVFIWLWYVRFLF